MEYTQPRIRKQVISLDIDLISYENCLAQIVILAKKKEPAYICFANVHMVIEAYKSSDFGGQVNRASLVLADGVPLVKTIKFFYALHQDRIAGMDVFPHLIKLADVNKLKIFFFGTTPELLQKIKQKTEIEFPGVKIAGLFSPPFEKSIDNNEYADVINNSGADLVFVSLGCPKQEKWMANHSHKIKAVLLGVGGAFPVYAGVTSRAPLMMRNLGLEWLFRLAHEPARLFKRYLTTNTLFIYLILKIKIKKMFTGFNF